MTIFLSKVTFNSLCCHYLTWITSKGRLPWRSCMQLDGIWLLYLIKCSLKRKSHRGTEDEGDSHGAMMLCGPVPLPSCQPAFLCHELSWVIVLLHAPLPDLSCHGKYLNFSGWEVGDGMANVNPPLSQSVFYSSDLTPLANVRSECIMRLG
jgi:hypothetical protein